MQEAAGGVLGVTQPCLCRCGASLRGGRNALARRLCAATNKPTPHTLLSLCQRSRLAAVVADDAGGLLPPPVSALTTRDARLTPLAPVRRVCLLLPPCVKHPLPGACPCLRFRRVAFCEGMKMEGWVSNNVGSAPAFRLRPSTSGESGSSSGKRQRRNTFLSTLHSSLK